jgi:hypothetical protein
MRGQVNREKVEVREDKGISYKKQLKIQLFTDDANDSFYIQKSPGGRQSPISAAIVDTAAELPTKYKPRTDKNHVTLHLDFYRKTKDWSRETGRTNQEIQIYDEKGGTMLLSFTITLLG